MRIRIIFAGIICCVLFASKLDAQITGTVMDAAGTPISFVTINLRNSTSHAIVAYTATDKNGKYILQLPVHADIDSLLVEARSIGYKTQTGIVRKTDVPLDFVLPRLIHQLEGVEIKSSQPRLIVQGDTLSYKVSDFSSPQDRVIGDVIKKLPGITVAADGTISYNNKPVSGVYIGGDNLLDDKYNIATNTIPQQAVDQVQVVENHQPVKALQGKTMSDDVALNLSFKKDARLRLVGEESIGAGLGGKYHVDLNALMFKEKYKAINYLRSNNIGMDLQRDLTAHNYADNMQRLDYALPASMLSLGTASDPALSKERYFFNQSGILNLNNLVNLNKEVQLKLNAYYLRDVQRQDYSQFTTVFLPEDTIRYSEIQRKRTRPDLLHSQLTLNVNRQKYYLNNALVLDYNHSSSHADLNTNRTVINQALKNSTRNFSNELNLISTLPSNHIIQAYSYVSYNNAPENRSINPDYNAAKFNEGVPYSDLVQRVSLPTWYTNNYVSYKIPSNIATISARAGFNIQSQQLRSELYATQLDSDVRFSMDSTVNAVAWIKKKAYAEVAYDVNGEMLKFNLTLPVSVQRVNYADNNYAFNKQLTRLFFNPLFRLKYHFGAEKFVSLFYNHRNGIGDVEDIFQGFILRDYRTLWANHSLITETGSHFAAVGFNYRKAITMFFCSFDVLYNYSKTNNIASVLLNDNMQQRIVLPYVNDTRTWTINSSVSKYSFALRTTFSGVIQHKVSRAVQLQNDLLIPVYTTVNMVNGGVATKVGEKVSFNYQVTLTDSHTQSSGAVNRIGQLLQQLSVYYIPVLHFQCKISADHYINWQQGSAGYQYFFGDASVRYKFKRCELELSGMNLFNVKKYDALFLSANAMTVSSYALPGRVILLMMRFNI